MRKKVKPTSLQTDTSVILMAGRFQFAVGERVLNRWVMSRMLLWCQEGKGRVRINGRWREMQADDFIFLPWHHEVFYHADEREPMRVGGIHIVPDYPLDRKLVLFVPHNIKDAARKWHWQRNVTWPALEGPSEGIARPQEPLRLLADYIIERFDAGPPPEPQLRQLAQLLVEEIARTVAQKPAAKPGNDIVRRAQDLVESHGARQFSLQELARLSNCSVSTLRRQFQQTLGMPPYEWMLQARMRHARRLLSTTTLRVKEVATQVGFEDPFQFSRTFRQRVGKSPRQFRAEHAFAPKSSLR
jgi:AraC-like DNA-binding protein/quercetin dioxygenase-like cupin family protein